MMAIIGFGVQTITATGPTNTINRHPDENEQDEEDEE